MTEVVNFIEVARINIPARQRSMDASVEKHIKELAEDIKENGLIHAVTLDADTNIVAGFCRMSAIRLVNADYFYGGRVVPRGFVPFVVTHKTSQKDLHRIELMENLRRKNLSVADEAKALAALHENLATDDRTWTQMDTADALAKLGHEGASQAAVSDALKIAQHADDPEIRAAGSKKEAIKIINKREEQQRRESLGALAELTGTNFTVYQGDCREIMKSLPDRTFAGIVVDPPYGIDASSFGEQSGINSHNYMDDAATAMNIIECIFSSGDRICKSDAHLYMFCDLRHFDRIADMAVQFQWTPHSTPLIWKKNMGHMPWPGYFQRQYECILFARHNPARKLSRVRSDVLDFPAVMDKVHSAEKPHDLLKELLSLSFLPGETVLDPCCGSGSIFPAAKALSLSAVGIEYDPAMAAIAKHRAATGE
jgi:DNA modification methylase/ParB-like chromosome segregation protein Spo0J